MKTSLIVPAHNSAATIEENLQSLLRQRGEGFEIIVVDDGSTDNTRDLVEKYSVRLITQENRGPAAARNNGAMKAAGDILVFTDSDCIVGDRWLLEMLKPFSDTKIVGVQGRYKTTQRELIARFAQYEIEERYEKMSKHKYIDFVGSYSAAYRKDVFLDAGGFDERFPIASGEDPDLSFRLAAMGHRMVFNPNALVYHRHPNTLWKYLNQKFYRAYWRVSLYIKHPKKIKKESYTPQMLKLQILLFYLLVLSFIFRLEKIAITLLFITTIPLTVEILRKDILVGLIAPIIIFLRTLVLGAGLSRGAIALILEHDL